MARTTILPTLAHSSSCCWRYFLVSLTNSRAPTSSSNLSCFWLTRGLILTRGIRERKKATPRPATDRNLDKAREAIRTYTGSEETDESIWQGIRKHTICLRVQQFLFKAMHNTLMIGKVWFNIQDFQHRGTCAPCGATENMSHILLTCEVGPTSTIWNLAKSLWPFNDI